MGRKEDALDYHSRGRKGKLEVVPTKPLVRQIDLSNAYTPGVAEPCLEILADEDKSWEYTARGNLAAVISNGTAVLGLGDIGPAAGKPVMEGKACLFKKFADIDVFDLEIAETNVDKFCDIVAALEPTFGGINLEDISAPACFEIEQKLRERMRIPVFHDDQHGTAIISGAGLLNASELAKKDLATMKLVVSGAGAGAIACVEFFCSLGMKAENVVLVDSKGVVHKARTDLNRHKLKFACADDGRRTLAEAVINAYGGKPLRMGPDYFIPKAFDPRALWWVAPAVAKAAIESGVARIKFDPAEYRARRMSKGSTAAYSIMRTIGRTARQQPKRIAFPHAANPRLLRAVQQITEEGIATPLLLGRQAEIEQLCNDMSLALLSRGAEINDPRTAHQQSYIDRFYELRQRKGLTRFAAQTLLQKSDYFAAIMVDRGDADGCVNGLRLNYPDTVKPMLEIFGLLPQCKVAVGMYMMVSQNQVKFFGDTVFNIDPDAETLANITLQMADAVQGFGVVPRVAMISYSNFGTVRSEGVKKIQQALEMVRKDRPDLEIDGEMQPELALDPERRRQYYPFSRLR